MPRPTILFTLIMLSLGWLLAACGQTAVSPTATPVPATAPPTGQPAPAAALPTAPSAAASRYADIPQGVTAEGYQILGDPAAPLTLVMYSDFF